MQVQVTPAILAELRQAVDDVDGLLAAESFYCDRERTEARGYTNDANRLGRYAERRRNLLAVRTHLQAVYIAITGEDPWKDIPY